MEKIVVGVDGSETAQQALEWAVAEAGLRGADLVVIHTWQQPTAALMSPYAPLLADPATLAKTARQTLTDSLAAVDFTGLAVEPEQLLVQGPAADQCLRRMSVCDPRLQVDAGDPQRIQRLVEQVPFDLLDDDFRRPE